MLRALTLVGIMIGIGTLLPIVATAEPTKVDIGPLSVMVVTNGAPLSAEYDTNQTSDVGDDSFFLFQEIYLIKIDVDLHQAKQMGLPVPSLHYQVDFQDTRIDHPVFIIANQTDEQFYDALAPEVLRNRVDIEYEMYGPRFRIDASPGPRRDAPFVYGPGMRYDSFRPPVTLSGLGTDGWLDVIARVWPFVCVPPGPEAVFCPTSLVPFPDGQVRSLTPNVVPGYRIYNGTVKVHGGQPISMSSASNDGDLRHFWRHEADSPLQTSVAQELESGASVILETRQEHRDFHASAEVATTPSASLPGATFLGSSPLGSLLVVLAFAILLPLLFLYSRLRKEQVLGQGLRRRIYDAICLFPGIHESKLAATVGANRQLVAYHTRYLYKLSLIVIRSFGKQKCYFQNGGRYEEIEQRFHAARTRGRAAEILDLLAEGKPLRQRDIVARLRMDRSNLRRDLARLQELQLILVQRQENESIVSLDPNARMVFGRAVARGFSRDTSNAALS